MGDEIFFTGGCLFRYSLLHGLNLLGNTWSLEEEHPVVVRRFNKEVIITISDFSGKKYFIYPMKRQLTDLEKTKTEKDFAKF